MTVKPGTRNHFDNLLMSADEYITVETAQRLAKELGFTDFDVQDYDF